jgi:hypothetical protein
MNIGTPGEAAYAVGAGWRRDYSGGTVLVNPSASTSQTFALGGTYIGPDGTATSTVTLPPTSGVVLALPAGCGTLIRAAADPAYPELPGSRCQHSGQGTCQGRVPRSSVDRRRFYAG